jgi:enamidase
MAQAAGNDRSGKVVIRNVGLMLSGDIDKPLLDADCVVVLDGRIEAVGRRRSCDTGPRAPASTPAAPALAPGLIDSHVHPVFGDWTPRQNQIGWIDSMMHGGVTTMISAGEVHLPGRPQGHRRPEGAGDHRAARLRQLPARRRARCWPARR